MTATTTDRLDGLASSTAVKGPCKAASTTNLTLSGEQTVNGVSIVADDRVLVTGQTDGRENGVYVAATSVWRRAKDFSSNNDVREGTQVRVNDGTNAGIYVVSTSDPIVFDTTSITLTRDTALTSGALMAANNLSDVASAVAALWNLRNNGADIASASTLVLNNATGDQVDVTGAVTITAVTLSEDREVWCRFTGTPQITVGASLVGNAGGANITLAVGDIVRFRGYAAGVVRFTVFPISGYITPTSTATLTNKTLTTPTLTLKQSTTPTPTAEGDIQWDTDDNVLAIGDGSATQLFVPIPASTAAGDIEYFSGAKAKARLAKGTANQHLAMNAGATAPEWVSANGMTLLGTLTTTSGTTQSLTGIAAGYRRLLCEIEGVSFTSTNALTVALSSTNGAAYGSAVNAAASGLSSGSNTITGIVEIDLVSSTGTQKVGRSVIVESSGTDRSISAMFPATNTAAVVDAIRFAGGTFDAGTIRIYGVK